MDPTNKFGGQVSSDTGFLFLGPESAFGMNPGACILDAFGQNLEFCSKVSRKKSAF